ncbi:unnamed protein product [Orchesella dallaii]|uniref:Gustatory receptor n=1 Tax=Orchesella dallaii TaxID=48710 RepID=A0ABP1R6M5_9HEXA
MESLLRGIYYHVEKHGIVCFKRDTITGKLILLEEITTSKKVSQSCGMLVLSNTIIQFQILYGELSTSKGWNGGELFNRVLAAYYFFILPVVSMYIRICYGKSKEIVLYINGLLQLSNKVFWKDRTLVEHLNFAFAWVLYPSIVLAPTFLVILMHWNNPCRSTLLGSWLLSECRSVSVELENENTTLRFINRAWAMLSKIFVLMVNHVILSKGCSATLFCMVVLNILCMLKLHDHLKSENPDNWSTWQATKFREIQVFALLNNEINQNALLVFTFSLILVISLEITAFVRMEWNAENFVALGFFSYSCFNSCFFLIIIMGGGMIAVYSTSKTLFELIKRKQSCTGRFLNATQRLEKRWLTKFCRSCTPLRVKLGESNFLEELTPLNCINTAVDLTVNMLLLGT